MERQASDLVSEIPGDWIGSYRLAAKAAVIRVRLSGSESRSNSIDLVSELAFRQPLLDLRVDADRLAFAVSARGGALRFDGRVAGVRILGSVQSVDASGSFELARIAPLSPPPIECVGTYRLGPDNIILIGQRGDAPSKAVFYARNDCLVPLHPLAPDTFFSERGEMLHFERDVAGAVRGLRWRDIQGAEVVAPKVALYHEEEVSFPSGPVTLAGTLLTPFGERSYPAVVLMHGTFPRERDFYRVYADRFARRGIAALMYDKRGSGASTGNLDSTIAERAEDGLNALRFLQARPAIDADHVGLWGFSNSTWSLPFAAARSGAVAFLVATGASGVSMARAEVHRRVTELRERNLTEDTLHAVQRAWTIAFEYAVTGRWNNAWDAEWGMVLQRLKADQALQDVPLPDYARADARLSPIPPLITAPELKERFGGAAPDMGYDPITDYERITCPVLFLVGAEDGNLPAGESAARVAEALKRAGNRDYMVRVLPETDHSMNVSRQRLRGITTEEAGVALHDFCFAPGYLALMADWILARAASARRGVD